MRTETRKGIFIAVLVLLALPTGVCSLFFTPMGFFSLLSHDSLEHSIGVFALICSAVGWAICGVSIRGAVRISRSATDPAP